MVEHGKVQCLSVTIGAIMGSANQILIIIGHCGLRLRGAGKKYRSLRSKALQFSYIYVCVHIRDYICTFICYIQFLA